MDYNKDERLDVLKNILVKNGLTFENLNDFLFSPHVSTSKIERMLAFSNISNNKITNYFVPSEERIPVKDIVGLDFEGDNIMDIFLKIQRFDVLAKNLGNFDEKKYYEDIKNSNFALLEKDGKYYVFGDGNHRVLLMLFKLRLTEARLKRKGANKNIIDQLVEDTMISAPIIHLKHDKNLLNRLIDFEESIYEKNSERGDYQKNFMEEYWPKGVTREFFLQYNKENNTYNMFYKGFGYANLSSVQVIEVINKIESYNFENDFYKYGDKFVISNKHYAIDNLPFEEALKMDKFLAKIDFEDFNIDYFIKTSYPDKTFTIDFKAKDYGDININHIVVNNFIKYNSNIFNLNTNDEEVLTHYNCLNNLHFENLDFDLLVAVFNTVKDLDKCIYYNSNRRI